MLKKRAWPTSVLLAIVLVAAACGDDGVGDNLNADKSSVSAERSEPATDAESVPYALLESPDWTLRDAIDPASDHILSDIEPLPSDWYAEYERFEPVPGGVNGLSVKLTGLLVELDTYRTSMGAMGVSFEPVDTTVGAGLSGTTADQGARPVIVAVSLGNTTLELLSYELSSGQLVALVTNLKMVDDAGWRAAGGQMR